MSSPKEVILNKADIEVTSLESYSAGTHLDCSSEAIDHTHLAFRMRPPKKRKKESMSVKTKKYLNKEGHVFRGIRLTVTNAEKVAEWCKGELSHKVVARKGEDHIVTRLVVKTKKGTRVATAIDLPRGTGDFVFKDENENFLVRRPDVVCAAYGGGEFQLV